MVWRTAAWSTGLEGLGSVVAAVDQQRPDLQPISDQMEQMQTVVFFKCVTVNSPLLLGLDAGLTRPSAWSRR